MIFLDLETQSTAELRRVGGHAYAAHPSSRILTACIFDGATLHAWPETPFTLSETFGFSVSYAHHQELPSLAGQQVCAHNAWNFDSLMWPEPAAPAPGGIEWFDSIPRIRRQGYPGALDKISTLIYGVGKDPRGERLKNRYSKVTKSRPRLTQPQGDDLQAMLEYCARDTMILAALWRDLRLGDPHPDDAVLAVDRAINRRGIPVDIETAEALRQKLTGDTARALVGVSRKLIDSPVRFRRWLCNNGVPVPDVSQSSITKVLAEMAEGLIAPNPIAEKMLVARQAISNIRLKKTQAILDRQVGGRIYGGHAYHGAHTGRWAGRGVQPQNFPKQAKDVRQIIRASPGRKLLAGDFSSVEARGVLWCADDQPGLDIYRRGEDPYKHAASDTFKVPYSQVTPEQRQVGKVQVLSLGYQGGAGALTRMAGKYGLKLPGDALTFVEAWRDSRPMVAGLPTGDVWTKEDGSQIKIRRGGLWRDIRAAVRAAMMGYPMSAGRVRWEMQGPDLVATLPSGRPIYYRGVQNDEDGLWYNKPTGGKSRIYGGKLTENIVQAICRDLMANAMVRLEAAGLEVVMHIHDEVCLDVEESRAAEVAAIVGAVPGWAAGFPLGVDYRIGERYE